ncbi:uncharacterized protein LOC106166605 isoform X2 [Lingula anatina]|uniref:Uncharacterized protein LOC106166605 isoform X2 n=1 Tax=Lingula anatina TaxID=7574 RepID=A0A1S3IR61_LINAN|nr:uncharacterized protein LOC106166605 isoform X2 [Lingula anatina]|eukprot:XP_013400692.1 uncharacterized protein LOC106166605 isoform X2 [Lingula anatina]
MSKISQITVAQHQEDRPPTGSTRQHRSKRELQVHRHLRRQKQPQLERVVSRRTGIELGFYQQDDEVDFVTSPSCLVWVYDFFTSRKVWGFKRNNQLDFHQEARVHLVDAADTNHGALLIKSYRKAGEATWYHFVRRSSGTKGTLAKKLKLKKYDQILAIDFDFTSTMTHEEVIDRLRDLMKKEEVILCTRRMLNYRKGQMYRKITVEMTESGTARENEQERRSKTPRSTLLPKVTIEIVRGSICTPDGICIDDIRQQGKRKAKIQCTATDDYMEKYKKDIRVSPLKCGDESYDFDVHQYSGITKERTVSLCYMFQKDQIVTVDENEQTVGFKDFEDKSKCDLENLDLREAKPWLFLTRRVRDRIRTFESLKYPGRYVACVKANGVFDILLVEKNAENQPNIEFQQFGTDICQLDVKSDSGRSSASLSSSSGSSESSASQAPFSSTQATDDLNVTESSNEVGRRNESAAAAQTTEMGLPRESVTAKVKKWRANNCPYARSLLWMETSL